MKRKNDPLVPLSGSLRQDFGNPKDEFVDTESDGTFSVSRDGALVGVGLSKDDAKNYIVEMSKAYPDSNFSIVPGGVHKPGDTEENPE